MSSRVPHEIEMLSDAFISKFVTNRDVLLTPAAPKQAQELDVQAPGVFMARGPLPQQILQGCGRSKSPASVSAKSRRHICGMAQAPGQPSTGPRNGTRPGGGPPP